MSTSTGVFCDVRALGVTVRIEIHGAVPEQVRTDIFEAWKDARFTSEGEPDAVVEVTVQDAIDFDRMIESLSTRVTLAAIENQRGRLWMFHAAGVALPDGRVVAFVGPSGRGKTTLSRILGRKFGYVSDETIALNDELEVFPYRKPLSVVRTGKPKKQVAPGTFSLLELPQAPLKLAAMVLLDRVPGYPEPVIEELSLVEALADLVPQTSYLANHDHPLQRLATVVDNIGGVARVRYSEADTIPPIIPKLAMRQAAAEPTWVKSESSVANEVNSGLVLGDVDDVIDFHDQIVTIVNTTVHAIGGIAPEIFRAVQRGASQDDLADAVVRRHGAPPNDDAEVLVAAAVEELIVAGLLSRK